MGAFDGKKKTKKSSSPSHSNTHKKNNEVAIALLDALIGRIQGYKMNGKSSILRDLRNIRSKLE